ncbi:hypothetical protein CERZMDRAFT_96230 [Cercospora zeae-maydis SCOH1-5]|uniref:Uncharacterized protein n=1 Tax=Cercospora zeae-maydis SCOH1-5 TaxID=717836 RepID=A0A6A6FIZ3_9PEZI|nr:hypothetical protein CERZMDRAFT_96230 [Cercospora zeae-maydis SCOH1-5]
MDDNYCRQKFQFHCSRHDIRDISTDEWSTPPALIYHRLKISTLAGRPRPAHYRADAIIANSAGCPGDATCTGRVAGAGPAANCSTSSGHYNLNKEVLDADGNSNTNTDGTYVFMSNFLWSLIATVHYPVVIDGNSSAISLAANISIFDDIPLSTNAYSSKTSFSQSSEICGYAFALTTRFSAWTYVNWAKAAGYDMQSQGSAGPQFASTDDIKEDVSGEASRVKFNDPTFYLLNQARALMFRTALAQGREISMSPIEMAKAFNAPLLADEDSNASVQELVKSAGTKPVQYGRVSEEPIEMGGEHGSSVQLLPFEHSGSVFKIADPAQIRSLRR